MMDFNERVIPGVSSNFMFKEALARYEFLKKFIKPGMKILDLGCGTGYGTRVLAKNGCAVLGIDIDSEAVAFAKKHFGDTNIIFQKGNILNFNSISTSYDLIVSFEVIEHLVNPKKFLDNVKGLLKGNGYFVMSTPNASVVSPKGGVASPYHEKEFNFEELTSILSSRFNKVEIFGQNKSLKAESAWKDFLESQKTREKVAGSDKLGIRRIIPKPLKEKIWKHFGNFFGRRTQENLETKDFPIGSKSVRLAYYFVALCRK